MTGAILLATRPAMIIRTDCRGDPRKTSAPKRAISKREALIDIISMAQQAKPNVMGQMEFLRAQLTAQSSLVSTMPSEAAAAALFTTWLSIRANNSAGPLANGFSMPSFSHGSAGEALDEPDHGAIQIRFGLSGEHRGLGFIDRKSTRLNSSHLGISYAVFCLKK